LIENSQEDRSTSPATAGGRQKRFFVVPALCREEITQPLSSRSCIDLPISHIATMATLGIRSADDTGTTQHNSDTNSPNYLDYHNPPTQVATGLRNPPVSGIDRTARHTTLAGSSRLTIHTANARLIIAAFS